MKVIISILHTPRHKHCISGVTVRNDLGSHPCQHILCNWVSLRNCDLHGKHPRQEIFQMSVDRYECLVQTNQRQYFLKVTTAGLDTVQKTLEHFEDWILCRYCSFEAMRDQARCVQGLRP